MTEQKNVGKLDFEVFRRTIEERDLDWMLGFYADDAEVSIVNGEPPHSSSFELRGKADISKYLRAAFGQETSHRVEQEVVGEERVTFREACEYWDGSRVVVETTLEVHDGKIVRQVDVVARDVRADSEEEIDRRETEGEER